MLLKPFAVILNVKDIPSNRFLFRLVPSEHRTGRDRVWFVAHRTDAGAETMQCGRKDGVCATEVASDAECKRSGQIYEKYNPGSQMGKGLTAMAVNGMLPTPTASDIFPGRRKTARMERAGWES